MLTQKQVDDEDQVFCIVEVSDENEELSTPTFPILVNFSNTNSSLNNTILQACSLKRYSKLGGKRKSRFSLQQLKEKTKVKIKSEKKSYQLILENLVSNWATHLEENETKGKILNVCVVFSRLNRSCTPLKIRPE